VGEPRLKTGLQANGDYICEDGKTILYNHGKLYGIEMQECMLTKAAAEYARVRKEASQDSNTVPRAECVGLPESACKQLASTCDTRYVWGKYSHCQNKGSTVGGSDQRVSYSATPASFSREDSTSNIRTNIAFGGCKNGPQFIRNNHLIVDDECYEYKGCFETSISSLGSYVFSSASTLLLKETQLDICHQNGAQKTTKSQLAYEYMVNVIFVN